MTDDSKRLMWRIPICVLIGIAMSLGLPALNLTPWLFLVVFIVMAIVITVGLIYAEEQIVIRTGIRPGMRVKIMAGAFKDKEGTVIDKKAFNTTLPISVIVDGNEYKTLFAQDELTQIKE